jgi:hypothetical protein
VEPIYPQRKLKSRKEYDKFKDKTSGEEYHLEFIQKPDGTHFGRNPKFKDEPKLLYFKPLDVEPIYPEKITPTFFQEQSKRQEQFYPDPEYPD